MHGEFCWRRGVLAGLEVQTKLRHVYVEPWTYCDTKICLSWSVRESDVILSYLVLCIYKLSFSIYCFFSLYSTSTLRFSKTMAWSEHGGSLLETLKEGNMGTMSSSFAFWYSRTLSKKEIGDVRMAYLVCTYHLPICRCTIV